MLLQTIWEIQRMVLNRALNIKQGNAEHFPLLMKYSGLLEDKNFY